MSHDNFTCNTLYAIRRSRSIWLKNINDDLTSFDMQLLEARDAAHNRPFWRMLASYSAMQL